MILSLSTTMLFTIAVNSIIPNNPTPSKLEILSGAIIVFGIALGIVAKKIQEV
jgi:hypothetical protein